LLEADEDDGFTEEILFEGFEIYSSETGCWVFHPHNSGWSPQMHRSRRTYFNGFLHFITRDERAVAALDMKGQTLGHGTPFLCGEAEMSSSLGIL
jgi:hypothetical protein